MGAEDFILGLVGASLDHRVVGKKRLQKLCYLLQRAGAPLTSGFALKNFGPFSTELDAAATVLTLFGDLAEEDKAVGPNGYLTTVYSLPDNKSVTAPLEDRYITLLHKLERYSTLELEMASTVLYFLERDNSLEQAIEKTKAMKPSKSSERVFEKSKQILELVS